MGPLFSPPRQSDSLHDAIATCPLTLHPDRASQGTTDDLVRPENNAMGCVIEGDREMISRVLANSVSDRTEYRTEWHKHSIHTHARGPSHTPPRRQHAPSRAAIPRRPPTTISLMRLAIA